MKTIPATMIVATLLCAAPLAQACQPGGPQDGWMLQEMDANKDGSVSKKEFDAFHAERFKEMDANKDGKVTPEEMEALHKKMMDKCKPRMGDRFDEVDINHDGQLSKEEAEIGMPMLYEHFDEIDTNKDGKLSKDEINESMKKMHDKMQQHRHGNDMPMMKPDGK